MKTGLHDIHRMPCFVLTSTFIEEGKGRVGFEGKGNSLSNTGEWTQVYGESSVAIR